MIKITNFAFALGLLMISSPAARAARTDGSLPKESSTTNSALDSLDDATIEALAICPDCKRRFLRDHKWTDERYAELLQERGKAPSNDVKTPESHQ